MALYIRLKWTSGGGLELDVSEASPLPNHLRRGSTDSERPAIRQRLLTEPMETASFGTAELARWKSSFYNRIQNEKELYLSLEELETRLRQHEEYPIAFKQVFGQQPRRDDIARALASFVRSLLVGDSQYDRDLQYDRDALSDSARRRLRIFRGKANCTACHAGPNLTDEEFHNTGVAWRDGKLLDEGRHAVTKRDPDKGAFKTPTLRQVSQTAPYMHDGSLATLAKVVERDNQGGIPNPHLDRKIRPLNLSDAEKKDLVSFLESLTGNIRF